ncbi:hypothetical protein FRB96_004654 [Tulasnella sp. 330]|nr:hypothetical protein FRB96_004654 [Tulasnella sp. 330]
MPSKNSSALAPRRALDIFYIIYFVVMIPISTLIELQSFYPPEIVPQFLKDISASYMTQSGDPLMLGRVGGPIQMAWFNTFTYCEAGFQVPMFFVALYGLLTRHRAVYIVTLIYGVHAATTTLPCLTTFLAIPTASSASGEQASLTLSADQKQFLIMNYTPFFLITLGMAIDSASNLWKMVQEEKPVTNGRKMD